MNCWLKVFHLFPSPPPSISSVIPSQVGCQVVAVLLHYFFLVTFMWMLMEGVVLYVALVRVFDKKKTSYIIAFTAISYGKLPALVSALYRKKTSPSCKTESGVWV